MARLPAEKQKEKQGVEVWWSVICRLSARTTKNKDTQKKGCPFTVRDVWDECRADQSTIRLYVQALVKAGYAEKAGATKGSPGGRAPLFVLVKKPRAAPRLRRDGSVALHGQGQENMWRVMQMQRGFCKHELAALASTEDVSVSVRSAGRYISHLQHAGYLKILSPSKPGTAAKYMLKPNMRTGPAAPMIKRTRVLFDPNTKKLMEAAQ